MEPKDRGQRIDFAQQDEFSEEISPKRCGLNSERAVCLYTPVPV